jgi:hypothetical protein
MVTLKISPCINVTLTFDFGLDQPVHRGYGWGRYTEKKERNCQLGYRWEPDTKTGWPTDRRS